MTLDKALKTLGGPGSGPRKRLDKSTQQKLNEHVRLIGIVNHDGSVDTRKFDSHDELNQHEHEEVFGRPVKEEQKFRLEEGNLAFNERPSQDDYFHVTDSLLNDHIAIKSVAFSMFGNSKDFKSFDARTLGGPGSGPHANPSGIGPSRGTSSADAQNSAISDYSAVGGSIINKHLRTGSMSEDDKFFLGRHNMTIEGRVHAIDDAIVSAPPFAKPMTVYRGMDNAGLGHLKPGDTVIDHGFGSVTSDPAIAARFGNLVTITVPAGTPGLNQRDKTINEMTRASRVPWESEQLPSYPPGAKLDAWKAKQWDKVGAERETILPRGITYRLIAPNRLEVVSHGYK